MPFEKTGKDEYTSPSGKKYTRKQVKLYHATDGFKEKPKIVRKKKKMG